MERDPRFIVYTVSEEYNEVLSKGDSEVMRSTDDKKNSPICWGIVYIRK